MCICVSCSQGGWQLSYEVSEAGRCAFVFPVVNEAGSLSSVVNEAGTCVFVCFL